MRSMIVNRTNLLNKDNNFEIVKHACNYEQGFCDLLEISKDTWQSRANTAIASDSDSINFYQSFASIAAKRNWLRIYVLKLNKIPIAFEYILDYKDKVFLLKVGFKEQYAKYSPGLLLLSDSIKDAFEKRKKEYDLLGESDAYKMRWTATCRPHSKYIFFNKTFSGVFLELLESKVIPILKPLKSICAK